MNFPHIYTRVNGCVNVRSMNKTHTRTHNSIGSRFISIRFHKKFRIQDMSALSWRRTELGSEECWGDFAVGFGTLLFLLLHYWLTRRHSILIDLSIWVAIGSFLFQVWNPDMWWDDFFVVWLNRLTCQWIKINYGDMKIFLLFHYGLQLWSTST